ncbi:MORN repeat-containing protein 3-like [Aulostomus maculatus]
MPLIKKGTVCPRSKMVDAKTRKSGLHGPFITANGDRYTGDWKDNKRHGKGTQVWKSSGATYDGEWKFGLRDGYGVYGILIPGKTHYEEKYSGYWKIGKKHGYGTYFYSAKSRYQGDWYDDVRSGMGCMYESNGDIYDGEWSNDKKNGMGIIQFKNGDWYDGFWKDDLQHGEGVLYYVDKGQIYKGIWENGIAKQGSLSDIKGKDTNEVSSPADTGVSAGLDTSLVVCKDPSV